MTVILYALISCFVLMAVIQEAYPLDFPGPAPGPASGEISDGKLILRNNVISCSWITSTGRLRPGVLSNRITHETLDLSGTEVFRLVLENRNFITASQLAITGKPRVEVLEPNPGAPRQALGFRGYQLLVQLVSRDGNLEVNWCAVLRNGSNAIRQEITFTTRKTYLPVQDIELVEIPVAGAEILGSVPGSPAVAGNLFFCYERPHSRISARRSDGRRSLVLHHPVNPGGVIRPFEPGRPVKQSSASGVVPPGQLRRGFLYYIERERAHPYRPFLHYNSWYDICWGNIKINEQQCLETIEKLGRELIEKRGVRLESFVWDDGWDDPKSLWRIPRENFPNGFSRMLAAARRYKSTLGVWMSPFGGYGKPKKDRLTYGRQQGFEIGEQGFLLSGPKYYSRFLEMCIEMIERNGVNFFKFDGLARGFAETEAMIRLVDELRRHKPDLFVSITTGTWPSPFWLRSGDSTWRGGADMSWHGEGTKREQWITYRDMQTYRGVVLQAPLYPLNSLMTQGFAHARHGYASENGNSPEEIRHELRSFFASGTCLQELYVSPDMMSQGNWDDLTEAAKWNHANADILVDTHWVGGDPGQGEPYGWASWSKRKGILALRNPSAAPVSISLDIKEVFEIPQTGPTRYMLKSPWKEDADTQPVEMEAGVPHEFKLKPFQVVVYDAVPAV